MNPFLVLFFSLLWQIASVMFFRNVQPKSNGRERDQDERGVYNLYDLEG